MFYWQHIQFESGANPWICKTNEEFERIKNNCIRKNYKMIRLNGNFWLVKDGKKEFDLFDFGDDEWDDDCL